jgi:Ran-binding protein 1
MADSSETKPTTDPSEPKLEQTETKSANHPVGSEGGSGSKEASTTEGKSSVAGMASNAASSATAAAAGVKDSMFSMFGGGAKKEKKVEDEDEDAKNEPSGSSKAQKKDADAEEVWTRKVGVLRSFSYFDLSWAVTTSLLYRTLTVRSLPGSRASRRCAF